MKSVYNEEVKARLKEKEKKNREQGKPRVRRQKVALAEVNREHRRRGNRYTTSYEELAPKVLKYLELGMNTLDACMMTEIADSTFYRWAEIHPEFKIAVEKARLEGKRVSLDKLRKIINARSDPRLALKALTFYLSRKYPDEWGEKKTISIDTVNESPIDRILKECMKENEDQDPVNTEE